jgi:RNA polymerase sigma-70 factor (ECF subfamily)
MDAAVLEGVPAAPAGTSAPIPLAVDGLITRTLGGELEAFDTLMILAEPRVLGVAWRLLGNRDQARDAAQEVFLRIFRSLASFRQGENFQAWMYRITVNVCADHARKRGPAMAAPEVLESATHAHPGAEAAEETVLLAERRALVRQALDTLTAAERAALVLRDLEGLSTNEVARTLGVQPVTIRSQLSTGRAKVQLFCAGILRRSSGGRP